MSTLGANSTKILVVDDHPMVRAGLQSMLDTEPDLVVVGEAGTAACAVRQARIWQPEVILIFTYRIRMASRRWHRSRRRRLTRVS